jgi:hypothetical protein
LRGMMAGAAAVLGGSCSWSVAPCAMVRCVVPEEVGDLMEGMRGADGLALRVAHGCLARGDSSIARAPPLHCAHARARAEMIVPGRAWCLLGQTGCHRPCAPHTQPWGDSSALTSTFAWRVHKRSELHAGSKHVARTRRTLPPARTARARRDASSKASGGWPDAGRSRGSKSHIRPQDSGPKLDDDHGVIRGCRLSGALVA